MRHSIIINCETGETQQTEFTTANFTQQDKDIKEAKAFDDDFQIAIQADATQKAALLARLGITADEAKLLIG